MPIVAAKMKGLPAGDFHTHGAKVRADGSRMRDHYLYQLKSPEGIEGAVGQSQAAGNASWRCSSPPGVGQPLSAAEVIAERWAARCARRASPC